VPAHRRRSSKKPRAVVAAITANILIAVAKFAAAYWSGSAAIFSEGIHSLVDTANGALLLYGIHRSQKPADATHPFGYGKELYFWTLVVATLILAGGGAVGLYQGYLHVRDTNSLEHMGWNYAILAISALCEGYSLRVAYSEFRQTKPTDDDVWSAVLLSKDPGVFAVLFEDSAALIGLTIAFLGLALSQATKNPVFDGIASVCIGLVLVATAVLLANETRHLLIGEGARNSTLTSICQLVQSDPAVRAAHRPLTMYLGPKTVLLALDIEFQPRLSSEDVACAVDRLEAAIRQRYPRIRHIYLEAESVGTKGRLLEEPVR
jgi:cation diffusion facilitator family transporter